MKPFVEKIVSDIIVKKRDFHTYTNFSNKPVRIWTNYDDPESNYIWSTNYWCLSREVKHVTIAIFTNRERKYGSNHDI